ncbi:hypothetical protein IKF33_01170 [Candidatus Saccharibacteria bacterium]|nr:hypothetical protein [Candidatus Saccharibacteria bacterium]
MEPNTPSTMPPVMPGAQGQISPQAPQAPQPMPQPSNAPISPRADSQQKDLIRTIVIIGLALVAATFIALFIWMFVQWNEANTAVEAKIKAKVEEAVAANTAELENDFANREKQPYKTFGGPIDYGGLSFEYPKTWSVYEYADTTNGDSYEAYFNPDVVAPISDDNIDALRLKIVNESTDEILEDYNEKVEDGDITVETRQINGDPVTIFTGQITDEFQGKVAVFKIRDKTVIIQTDATIFFDEFAHVLDTINYNK